MREEKKDPQCTAAGRDRHGPFWKNLENSLLCASAIITTLKEKEVKADIERILYSPNKSETDFCNIYLFIFNSEICMLVKRATFWWLIFQPLPPRPTFGIY